MALKKKAETIDAAANEAVKETVPAAEEKKAPAKKAAAKKTAEKKPAEKKTTAKKTSVKKAATEAVADIKEEVKATVKKVAAKKTAEKKPAEEKAAAEKPSVKKAAAEVAANIKEEVKATVKKAAAKKAPVKKASEEKTSVDAAEIKAEEKAAVKEESKKPAEKKAAAKKPAAKKPAAKQPAAKKAVKKAAEAAEDVKDEVSTAAETSVIEAPEVTAETISEAEGAGAEAMTEAAPEAPALPEPRRSVAFIGSECYPFVKTGGLGDVMYALPRALVRQNCDVKVILPRYKSIPLAYQDKMIYRGAFEMDLCADGKSYYVGIMEYIMDGVVYDFIDNEEFFSWGNPYTNLVDDIAKYCFFSKAALAALNYLDWTPDVIHCHDWQAGLVPLYLRTQFKDTPVGRAKVMITIHNLRFQGIYSIEHIKYWSGLPAGLFNKDVMTQNWVDANMFKGGLTYADMITTVSGTYAGEIQTPEFGEGLDAHLRYHSGKLRGIINGIDYELWDPAKDSLLAAAYDSADVLEKKRVNKLKLQEELGLEQDENKFVIGLISRLTNQKGLDLVNAILPQLIDGNTQVVVLGTGDPYYEDSFRYYENAYKGSVCSNIMYNEGRAHHIYAGADALLVPSQFEPCGLTQLIAMHYGTVPVVRETGGLKDTVQPYNEFTNEGNGFTFDRYDAGLLLDAINYAKTVYFTDRVRWDEMVQRDMAKDVSWENSAKQYRDLYLELTPW
ncbi:MAG: glycogen/starch synthase [Lachnospiraceae bacterium]|nr:glycogen/starch synthase [Lachnospiraceae bacterium]